MTVTQVNTGQGNTTSATSQAVTMTGSPTAGNLLVALVYSGATNTTTTMTTPTGWTAYTAAGGLAVASATPLIMYYRVAQAGDGTSWTFAGTGTATLWFVFVGEFQASGGAWAATPTDQNQGTGGLAPASTSITLTDTAVNAQATDFGIAAVSLNNATPGFSTTWGGGFVDSGVIVGSRLTHATKEISVVETSTTSLSWTASGSGRGVLGTFKQPAGGTVTKQSDFATTNRARFRASLW